MKTKIKNILQVLALLIISSSCVGDIIIDGDYDDWGNNRYEAEQSFYYTVDVSSEEIFLLNNINGDVIVEASVNTDQIIVSGTMIVKSTSKSDAESHLSDLDVDIDRFGATVSVESEFPHESNGRDYSIEYHIILPADFKTKVILINGWVQIVAMLNDIEVTNVNGDIDLDETYGNIDLEVINGNIDCKHELSHNGDADLKSTNGNIDLRIPESTSAEVYAQSTNGIINTSNLDFSSQYINPHSFYGVLNTGDGLISLNTTNGNISLSGF